MESVVQHPRTAANAPLRLAVYHPAPAAPAARSLARQFGGSVQARVVHRAQEVRATDDLVVVIAGAATFVRSLADSLGALAPPVLLGVCRGDQGRLPAVQATGNPGVDRLDGLIALAVLATARCSAGAPTTRAAGVSAEPLTPRERDIMALLATGRSIREIADSLALTGKTVRNYLSNIYRKLGVRRQAEALVRWLSSAELQAAA